MKRNASSPMFVCVRDFLCTYLPHHRNASPHTVRAYRTALRMYFAHLAAIKGKRLVDVTFDDIDRDSVLSFLDSQESERHCHLRTRNLRLYAIRSFMTYSGSIGLENIGVLSQLTDIPVKRELDRNPVKFASEKALAALLAAPDPKTRQGRRDRAVMSMLYDTAARVHELLDITLHDLDLSSNATVVLHGKGGRSRIVPLMRRTAVMMSRYLAEFHPSGGNEYLFFADGRHGRRRMTEDNIRHMVRKYADIARASCAEVPKRVHPHMFRHSRAMHLYTNGMDLTFVSQWLGHVQFSTTLIYAQAGTEQKRKAIEAATPETSPLKAHLKGGRTHLSDEDTLLRLYGLS